MAVKSVSTVIFVLVVFLTLSVIVTSRTLQKRSFAGLGCMGSYDKSKFARLHQICEECYQLYREPDVHSFCRSNCFKNSYFTRCVDALLLHQEQKELDETVEELYGKK